MGSDVLVYRKVKETRLIIAGECLGSCEKKARRFLGGGFDIIGAVVVGNQARQNRDTFFGGVLILGRKVRYS